MKKNLFFIQFDHNQYYMVAEISDSAYKACITEISDDCFFDYVTENQEPLYSNKTDDWSIKKDMAAIEAVLGYRIFNHYDTRKLLDSFDMVTIFKF